MQQALSLALSAAVLASCIAGCSRPSSKEDGKAARPAPAAPAPAGNDARAAPATRLTIYSGDYETLAAQGTSHGAAAGFVLVERELGYALKDGVNRISAQGLPRWMDAEAATLRPLGRGVEILSQRHVSPPRNAQDVMATAIGQRVTVEHTSGGAKQTDTGILVSGSDDSAGAGLTLALSDGRIKVIREFDNFSLVDAAATLPQQAALRWTVQAANGGDMRFRLDYPMSGMAWRAEYLATLAAGDGCRLDLDGAALVANRSGVGFDDARLTLVAGAPNQGRDAIMVTGSRLKRSEVATDMAQAAPSPMPEQRRSGEYHAYELPGAFDLGNGSTERVPLFQRLRGVACGRAYETTPAMGPWQPPRPLIEPGYNDQTGPQPVKATVSLNEGQAKALQQALPAGRVRVFEGRDFLGESMLPHTPRGADIRLEVGTAFDLAAERERTAFNVDRAGRSMTESFAVTLKNAKAVDTTVVVVEPIPRWSAWEIVESSVPAEKRDAQRAEFEVTVPAGGEARLTYTARYRWAPDVRP